MSVPSGRWIALQALLLAREEGLQATDALEEAWEESGARRDGSLDFERERGLSMGLVLGVVRWEIKLDGIMNRLVHHKAGTDVHPTVRAILHLGLFQLLYMDRIPSRAAVSETVALTRFADVEYATGFVNGCLRTFLRDQETVEPPSRKGLRGLAEQYAHPKHVVRALSPLLGDELEDFLKASQALPPLTLRVNSILAPDASLVKEALEEDDIAFEACTYAPDSLRLVGSYGRPDALPGFEDGLITVQDEASQLVAYLLDVAPGMSVLDACAAPGGKTALIAQLMESSGTLYAVDPSGPRLKKTLKALTRLGASDFAKVRQGRWAEPNVERDDGSFPMLEADEALGMDRILVDAPCTAWGVVRRHPEIKLKRTPDDSIRMAGLQQGILQDVAGRLKPGGILVYSVCSPLSEEGEGVIEAFLVDHPEFTVEAPPEGGPVDFSPFITEGGAIRTWPHRHGTDAFFAVRLRRQPAS